MRFSRPAVNLGVAATVLLCASALAGQTPPPAASVLLNQAKVEAAGSQRVIFAIFHASW